MLTVDFQLPWNGHVGGTGMLVERACWWNGHVGGTGMLVEWACWWNGHLGGMGILPVINIPRRAGCPPHSYSSRPSAMPKILCTS
ncbi:MAG: hypothetical protein F6J94_14060 [Moorea sp. SIO1F2]|nr:hypothetical protein [Moorena sp. SIO1F2]